MKVLHFTIRDKFVRTCNSIKLKNKENYDTKNLWEKENLRIKTIATANKITKT